MYYVLVERVTGLGQGPASQGAHGPPPFNASCSRLSSDGAALVAAAIEGEGHPPTITASPAGYGTVDLSSPRNAHLIYKKVTQKKREQLTASPEALSSSRIYESLGNTATGKLHGSFWIHLGNDDIHREICGFSFKKFSAAFEIASFIPCNVQGYSVTRVAHLSFWRKHPTTLPCWSSCCVL